MKVVLDTNVILSALGGNRDASPARILRRFWNDQFVLLLSDPLIAELRDVLSRPANLARIGWNAEDAGAFIHRLIRQAELVEQGGQITVFADDPDNRLLETSAAAQADFLVSGDRKVVALGSYGVTQIVTPAAFLRVLQELYPEPEA